MKTENLISTAKELNEVLVGLDPIIDLELPANELPAKIKEAALWLWKTDDVSDASAEVLRSLKWTKDDLTELDEEQDPLPAFERYGIVVGGQKKPVTKKKAVVEPKAKKEPEVTVQAKDESVPEPFKEVIGKNIVPVPEPTPEPEEGAEEHLEAPKPNLKATGPSAYGTAIAILGKHPETPLHEIYDIMKKRGFDLAKTGNSIKTAHSICRKVYYLLKEHGHIKE